MRKIWLLMGKNLKLRNQISYEEANRILSSRGEISVYTSLNEIREDIANGILSAKTKVLFQRKRAYEYEVFL